MYKFAIYILYIKNMTKFFFPNFKFLLMEKKDTFKIILNKSEKDIHQLALKKSNISD